MAFEFTFINCVLYTCKPNQFIYCNVIKLHKYEDEVQ